MVCRRQKKFVESSHVSWQTVKKVSIFAKWFTSEDDKQQKSLQKVSIHTKKVYIDAKKVYFDTKKVYNFDEKVNNLYQKNGNWFTRSKPL